MTASRSLLCMAAEIPGAARLRRWAAQCSIVRAMRWASQAGSTREPNEPNSCRTPAGVPAPGTCPVAAAETPWPSAAVPAIVAAAAPSPVSANRRERGRLTGGGWLSMTAHLQGQRHADAAYDSRALVGSSGVKGSPADSMRHDAVMSSAGNDQPAIGRAASSVQSVRQGSAGPWSCWTTRPARSKANRKQLDLAGNGLIGSWRRRGHVPRAPVRLVGEHGRQGGVYFASAPGARGLVDRPTH
jgi:hypothetical protein